MGLVDCVDKMLSADRGRLLDCPCVYGDGCRHVQSMRHELSPIPWQADYLYASKLLADRLTKVELRDDEDVARFSDHLPLIAEFDL